jgi:PhzF family phenazine biosynthesis protein
MRIPVFTVDAFARQRFTGNPAAVCPLSAELDDWTMGKVASECNISATAFFVPRQGVFDIRWFSPSCEIQLCGHATLAAAYVLTNLLRPDLDEIRFETREHRLLTVRREGEILSMDFPRVAATTCKEAPNGLLQALSAVSMPKKVLEANQTSIVVFDSEREIRDLKPDFMQLHSLHPFATAVTAPGKDVDYVCRYFAPSYGVPEDPVTGSAQCALAPYWANRLKKRQLQVKQLSARGGEMECEVKEDRVTLKGQGVLTMQGTLNI